LADRCKHFLKQTLGEVMIKSHYRGKFRQRSWTQSFNHKSGGGETMMTLMVMMIMTSLTG